MLGIHTQTRPVIIQALWQYVKTHKLQDPHEREFINCDKYLQQVRACEIAQMCMKHVVTLKKLAEGSLGTRRTHTRDALISICEADHDPDQPVLTRNLY